MHCQDFSQQQELPIQVAISYEINCYLTLYTSESRLVSMKVLITGEYL